MAAPTLGTPILSVDLVGLDAMLSWFYGATQYQSIRDPNTFEVLRDGTVIQTLAKTARNYEDTGLTEGTVYTYQIRAIKGAEIVYSNVVEVTTDSLIVLTAPTLTSSHGDAQVSLSWSAVSGAEDYAIQRAVGAGSFAHLDTVSTTSKTDSTVSNGTTYKYRVRARMNSGATTGPWSNEVSEQPAASVPVAPVLTGTAGDNQNSLDWNSVANAATYRVRRGVNGGAIGLLQEVSATDYIDDSAVNGTPYQYEVRGVTSGGVLGSLSNQLTLTPVPAAPPEAPAIVGFGSATTGGTGGTVYTVSTYAQFKAAIEASGRRIINVTGSNVIDGNRETLNVENPNLTINGTAHTKSFKRLDLRIKCSNVFLTNLRLRPGDDVNTPDDVDGLTINGNTEGLSNVVVDHCSILWGPDVTLAILCQVSNVTVQYCMLGAGLRLSQHSEARVAPPGHSYGPNVSTIDSVDPDLYYGKRITFYHNYIFHNYTGRNIRGIHTANIEYVNNVVYNWSRHLAHVNPRSGDYVGNIFKKGPGTPSSNLVAENKSDPHGSPYQNSVYFPLSGPDKNLALGFTPTSSWQAGSERTSRVAAAGGALAAGLLTAATSGLANTIVAAARPATIDAVDQSYKDDWTYGTGTYVNGMNFPLPRPTW